MLIAFIVAPLVSQAATLEDGKYSLPFQVNNSGSTSASYGNDYFVKPATLVKKDGQMYVQFTVKNSAWIHTLTGHEGGNKVISKNEGADTRVVQLNISDPFGKTGVDMKIDVDELNYHHEYTVDFVWFGDKATLIESYAKSTVKDSQTSAATSQAPSTNTQPKQQTEQKKAEVKQPAVVEKKQQSVAATETKQDDKKQPQTTDTKVTDEKESEKLAEDKNEIEQLTEVKKEDEQQAQDIKKDEQLTKDKKEEAIEETEEVQIEQVNEAPNQALAVENESSHSVLWISLSIIVVILLVATFVIIRKRSKMAK
jgi:heme-binding NEAT domain protein